MKTVHPLLVRITHWINALAILVMVTVGLEDLQRLAAVRLQLPGRPDPGRLAGGRAAVAFRRDVAAGAERPDLSCIRDHLRPPAAQDAADLPARNAARTSCSALRGRLAHDDLSVYNAAQKAAYLGAILLAIGLILSGLAIWKPVQLYALAALMGDYEGARLLHFFCMAGHRAVRAGARGDGDPGAEDLPHHDHGETEKWIASSKNHAGPAARQRRAAPVPEARPVAGRAVAALGLRPDRAHDDACRRC